MLNQSSSFDRDRNFLDRVELFLREAIAPQAANLDRDPQALCTALQSLGQRSLLALRVTVGQEQNGTVKQGVDEETYRSFQELVARYSGALAFLQTQHQSAATMIASSQNEDLKRLCCMNQ
jgi:alkylation response protein AidB-like acyl-CoA dehydrogenase